MGLLGSIVGGALQGVGAGITQQAIQKRTEALEAMRQSYQTQREEVANQRQDARDEKQHEYRKDESDQGYQQQTGLLLVGGRIAKDRDASQHGYKIEEIKTEAFNRQQQSRLDSQLAQGRTESEIKLRKDLENGDITQTVRGADGHVYGITKNGQKIDTGVISAPTAAELGDTGGGTLSDAEQGAAYSSARQKWVTAGRQGQEPQRSDFIGMRREDYRKQYGGSTPAPSPSPTPSPPKQSGDPVPRIQGTLSPKGKPAAYPDAHYDSQRKVWYVVRDGKKMALVPK